MPHGGPHTGVYGNATQAMEEATAAAEGIGFLTRPPSAAVSAVRDLNAPPSTSVSAIRDLNAPSTPHVPLSSSPASTALSREELEAK